VLPIPLLVSAPLFSGASEARILSQVNSPVFEPASPPPRTLPLSL
jgi:hypothetical protein